MASIWLKVYKENDYAQNMFLAINYCSWCSYRGQKSQRLHACLMVFRLTSGHISNKHGDPTVDQVQSEDLDCDCVRKLNKLTYQNKEHVFSVDIIVVNL